MKGQMKLDSMFPKSPKSANPIPGTSGKATPGQVTKGKKKNK